MVIPVCVKFASQIFSTFMRACIDATCLVRSSWGIFVNTYFSNSNKNSRARAHSLQKKSHSMRAAERFGCSAKKFTKDFKLACSSHWLDWLARGQEGWSSKKCFGGIEENR